MAITPYTFDLKKAASYLDLCFDLYRSDPNWIPPLRKRAMAQFSESLFFYRCKDNAHRHFLATADGKPVGHVTAIFNARLREADGSPIGAVGFFECKEEPALAGDLLAHAVAWLRDGFGIRRIWAPIQFDIWNGYRFMVRGFDEPTFFGEPYNKAWYPGFFESRGFAIRKRWYSVVTAGRATLLQKAAPQCEAHDRALADGYVFVPMNVRNPDMVRSLQSAVEGSYHRFLGISPLDTEEFSEIFVRYAEALDSRFAMVAYDRDGRLSGFAVAYPDYGQALRAMRGRDSLVAKARFYIHSRLIKRAIFFMIGITPQEAQRRRGLGRALFYRCLTAMIEAGYDSVVFALLAEDSPAWPLIEASTKDSQKEYALYEATFER